MATSALRPSASNRWVWCPGSVILGAGYDDKQGEAARKGTEAHEVAASILKGLDRDVSKLDPDMAEAVRQYLEVIWEDRAAGDVTPLRVEYFVESPEIHPTISGTVDAWYFDYATSTLRVYDLKTGYNPVSAWNNTQLMIYASGIISSMEYAQPCDHVELVIVQRCHRPADRWRITVDELRQAAREISYAAEDALGDGPLCHAGDHCRYCRGRHVCEAARASALSVVDMVGQPLPDVLDDEAIAYELQVLTAGARAVKHRLEALEAEAAARIGEGRLLPGWKLERGKRFTVWSPSVSVDEIVTIGAAYGADLRVAAVTPKQAIKAGVPEEIVNAMSTTPEGALKLTAVKTEDAERVFSTKG